MGLPRIRGRVEIDPSCPTFVGPTSHGALQGSFLPSSGAFAGFLPSSGASAGFCRCVLLSGCDLL